MLTVYIFVFFSLKKKGAYFLLRWRNEAMRSRIGTMTSSLLKILDDLQWQINPFLDDIRPLIFLENVWIITQILYFICRYSSVYSQKARGDETCPLGPIQSMCSAWHDLNDPSKDKYLGVTIHLDQTCLLTRSQWLIFTLKMVIIDVIQIILYKFHLLLINFSITSQLFWHPLYLSESYSEAE